jgi:hypothetical protein
MDIDIRALQKMSAVPDEVLIELGRTTAHFALLEYDLVALVHHLLGLDDRTARSITSELSFRGLQNLSYSLVVEKRSDREEDFKAVLKLVANSEEKRNQIAHSLWGFDVSASASAIKVIRTKYTAKQRSGLRFNREVMTPAAIQKIAMDISIATYEVERFRQHLA